MKSLPRWHACCLGLLLTAVVLMACPEDTGRDQQVRDDPREYFDFIALEYHQAAEQAHGEERTRLLEEALGSYADLEARFPDEAYWRAEARLASGHVFRLLGRNDEALAAYASVVEELPSSDFQILMAIKSQIALLGELNDQVKVDELCHDLRGRFAGQEEQVFQTAIKSCSAAP